jgi:hypothetical protein
MPLQWRLVSHPEDIWLVPLQWRLVSPGRYSTCVKQVAARVSPGRNLTCVTPVVVRVSPTYWQTNYPNNYSMFNYTVKPNKLYCFECPNLADAKRTPRSMVPIINNVSYKEPHSLEIIWSNTFLLNQGVINFKSSTCPPPPSVCDAACQSSGQRM